MSFNTKHPEYQRYAHEWKMVTDAVNGEDAIKQAGVQYLPMSAGMIIAKKNQAQNVNVDEMYHAYKLRAQYPEWVRDAVRAMAGMVSRLKPKMTLEQAKISGMEFSATSDSYPLSQLFVRVVLNNIKKGRFGLLCDVDDDGLPFIATYDAESIINWKTEAGENGRQDLSLLVLKEEVLSNDDIFSHATKSEYLVYRLVDGQCQAYRLNDAGQQVGEVRYLTKGNTPLGFIPFVFSGAIDNSPDVDVVPLMTMIRAAIKYYQISADYYQELHLTAHPQPVITGQDLESSMMVTGPMMSWVFPSETANAFYLEISGTGIEAKRQAMSEQKNAALEAGARVMDIGGVESGEARQARQNDQYATLHGIVKNSAEAIEQCLRYLGEWYGFTPEQANEKLKFTVELDFDKVIDIAVLQQLFNASQMSMVSPETVWEYMQTGQIPERNWDDEQGRILSAGLVNESAKLP